MAFRFMHMADVHLDTPFQSRDEGLRRKLRELLRQTFKAGIDLVLSKRCHALLIAGDLFDNDTLSFATEKFLLQQFNRLNDSGIQVFYSPGNHDPSGSIYRRNSISWPSNVHVFDVRESKSIEVIGHDGKVVAVIHGAGHESKNESMNLVKEFPCAVEGIPNIGLIHTFVSGASASGGHERYAPCSVSDLIDKKYSYWALGHVHTRCEVIEEPLSVYPGNIMGRNPAETGSRGIYHVEIDDNGRVSAEFNALSPVLWHTVIVDELHDTASIDGLEQKIIELTMNSFENSSSYDCLLLRIILKGPCPLYNEIRKDYNLETLVENIKGGLNADQVEIITDNITRPLDPEIYKDQSNILGTALSMLDRIKCDDEYLLSLMDDNLAGCEKNGGREDRLNYIKGLLEGLDYEVISRLLKEGCR